MCWPFLVIRYEHQDIQALLPIFQFQEVSHYQVPDNNFLRLCTLLIVRVFIDPVPSLTALLLFICDFLSAISVAGSIRIASGFVPSPEHTVVATAANRIAVQLPSRIFLAG